MTVYLSKKLNSEKFGVRRVLRAKSELCVKEIASYVLSVNFVS